MADTPQESLVPPSAPPPRIPVPSPDAETRVRRSVRATDARDDVRGAVRTQPREIDRADEAAQRKRTRRGAQADKFFIDPAKIPNGWDYQWRRISCLNEPDPGYEVMLYEQAFTPVPARRHPEMVPPSYKGETIERDGLLLMERPMRLTKEAQMEELAEARSRIAIRRQQMGETPQGTLPRDHDSARAVTKVVQEFAPLSADDIPSDEEIQLPA
jgi:hypothetical protein